MLATLAARTRTLDRRSPSRRARRLLALMHAVGRLFPRGDRAPAIEPVRRADAAPPDGRRRRRCSAGSRAARSASPAASTPRRRWSWMRAMNAALDASAARAAGTRLLARASCRSPTRPARSCRWRGCCGCRCSRSRSAWPSCC
ncbi:MAG: hypothetical protein MZV49_17370 [Rhodopseudomonas palustris]|nr:hypothetical protein [Rhodopseudomonas palustris]